MIEITTGTLQERVIKLLQKTYPITVIDIKNKLNISRIVIERLLQQLQVKGIVRLDALPDKTYVRLLRNDFSFVGKRRQRKFIKHRTGKKPKKTDYDGIMYY
jgi:predicted ArsR family transcriptional regulator